MFGGILRRIFVPKGLQERLWSGRAFGSLMFAVTRRRLARDMRVINKYQKRKVTHAKKGEIKKTKKDLDQIMEYLNKFEEHSKDMAMGLVKFENYELGNIQSLEDFIKTLEKLGFPKGVLAEDSGALLILLRRFKETFKGLREHFGVLEEKTDALIKQSEKQVGALKRDLAHVESMSKKMAKQAKRAA